nr:lysosomal acid phosphatase-like [Leptinotarsa decemlineata]
MNYPAEQEKSELLSVVVIFRHGDRSPIYFSYPTDPYAEMGHKIWPDGFGQLTNLGKKQTYDLGKWLRNRYKGFLPDLYSHKDIRVESSNSDRCLMSAAATVAGLFPPVERQIWNSQLHWMPIPIHTTPEENDPVIAMEKPCPKYNKMFKELRDKKFEEFAKENGEFLGNLSRNTGKEINSFELVMWIYDILLIESTYNLTLPEWTETVSFNKLKSMYFTYWGLYTANMEMCRYRSGPLIDLIATKFEDIIKKVTDTPKFLMLSGHDITILSVLSSLKLLVDCAPEYASALIFELRSSENKGQFVNILYKNQTDNEEVVKLRLNEREFNCKWKDFRTTVEPLRVSSKEWKEACSMA